MPRKKSICSANVTLQVDGTINITIRVRGHTASLSALDQGHGRKLYRAVAELEQYMKVRFDKANRHEDRTC